MKRKEKKEKKKIFERKSFIHSLGKEREKVFFLVMMKKMGVFLFHFIFHPEKSFPSFRQFHPKDPFQVVLNINQNNH